MILTGMKSFFISSSIGRKIAVGLTGIFLAFFILAHMAGNLLLFKSAEIYNRYAHSLTSNPIIIPLEVGLAGLFLIHIIWALALALYNRKSKGPVKDTATSLIHKTLHLQGVVILVFTALHLYTFKYGTIYMAHYLIDGQMTEVRDLFSLVAEVFNQHIYVIWYIFSLSILFIHLNHGLQASIRSVGFYHEKYTPLIKKIGLLYAILVSVGFISQPVYFYFFYQGGINGI